MRSMLTKVGLAAALGAAVLTAGGTAQSQGWLGFQVETAPSVVGVGSSPSWGLGITEDLGGPAHAVEVLLLGQVQGRLGIT